jgi:putative ABC transport system permease protein
MSAPLVAIVVLSVALCASAAGVFPVAATRGRDVQSALRERTGSATRRLALLRKGLVVAQLTFACVLVYGAALLIASVRAAQQVQIGFQPDGLLTFRLSLPRDAYPTAADVAVAFRTITEELRSVPGVSGVALASNVPLGAEFDEVLVGVEGRPFRADGTDPGGDRRVVSPAYFQTMGIPVLAGRTFAEGDAFLDGTPVVLSASMAAQLWPRAADAIGHRVRIGPYAPWMTIIGVVGDVRNRSLTLPSRPELYLPFGAPRSPVGVARGMTFVVRGAGSLARVREAAERLVRRMNPDLPLYGVRRFDEVVSASQAREVTTMRTLTGFAAIALALAVAGSYALLMFAVAQRGRELALRQAVGARGRDLAAMVAREMSVLLLAGVTLGAIGAAGAARLLGRFLFGVSALDARVTAATFAVVAAAGLLAALVPARRAATVDPMSLLRSE